MKLNGREFTTKSGAEYVYLSDMNIVLSKNAIEAYPQRRELLSQIPGYKKTNEYYDCYREYTPEEIKLEIMKNGLCELAIEVTSACNFRCEYCVYSGKYENQRPHDYQNMDVTTVFKAIDKYYELIEEGIEYNSDRTPVISYYGGEPLVKFDLIKKCTEYAKEKFDNNILFTITTNGSLMNDDVIDFFVNEKFNVVVSIDGYKENHNRNRKDVKGNATFDSVIENARKLFLKQGTPVFTSVVFDYDTDFVLMEKFFRDNDFLVCLSINSVNPYSTTYFDKYTVDSYDRFKAKLDILMKEFELSVVDNEANPLAFMSRTFGDICTSSFMRQCDISKKNNKIIKHTGACVPGNKIFVDVNGNFYICEKVGRSIVIGNVEEGINYEKCAQVVNRYNNLVVHKCRNCVIRNNCKRCYVSIDMDENKINIPAESCKKQIEDYFADLSFAYSIFESNPKWIGRYFSEYYDAINDMMVMLR